MFSSLISSSSSDPAGATPGSGSAPGQPVPPDAAGAYAPAAGTAPGGGAANGTDPFGLFRDVSCPVDVVLGMGQISLRRCLALERGSVVRLHQSAGEDVQVMVKGIRIAHAEVVIIDETVAVRLTNFAGPIGREKRL
jgi:flagellar motor switch protein FliN/FliY